MGIVLIVLVVAAAGGLWFLYSKIKPEALAHFIRDNPERSAIYLVRNDSVLVSKNPDKVMPLASTVKIIIAVEFARQAASGQIDPTTWVDTLSLEPYYIPGTDGDAHSSWLKDVKKSGKLKDDRVQLLEVAKGMINFSSNANSEYLMARLGLDKINANLSQLELSYHQPLYPFVSALYVFQNKSNDEIARMTLAEYVQESNRIHVQLPTQYKHMRATFKMIPLKGQRIWSDRLPASTVREYAGLMKKINSRTFFEVSVQQQLDQLMEGILEEPKNSEWLAHAGMKGGSTAWVLTEAMYATTKKGDRTELVYFFDGLTVWESALLQAGMNAFALQILSDEKGRAQLVQIMQ
jgi:D-alanyl-D-alanine carboxypeptidase